MKKRQYIFLFIFIGLLIAFFPKLKLVYKYYISPCYYNGPVKQQDFEQVFLPVNLDAYYQNIQLLAHPDFSIDTLETITHKSIDYPILSLSSKNTNNSKNKMLILAGVHGNESAGVLAIPELLKQYNKSPKRFANWNLKIVTPINPVGVQKMSRHNECGCDLNRKIKSSNQKGIVLQRNLVDTFEPNVIISMHEAPSSGFLIHSNELLKDELLVKILEDSKNQGIQLASKDYFGRNLQIEGNSKISGVLKLFNRLFRVQALGDYVTPKGIVEITTESDWNTSDQVQRVQSHVFSILSAVDHFNINE